MIPPKINTDEMRQERPPATISIYYQKKHHSNYGHPGENASATVRSAYKTLIFNQAYEKIWNLFNLDQNDMIVVLMTGVGPSELELLASDVSSTITILQPSRIMFFLEEISCLYDIKTKKKLTNYDDIKHSGTNLRSKELSTIDRIVELSGVGNYEIFGCERNIRKDVRYFDWCLSDQVDLMDKTLIALPDKHGIDKVEKKISCFNRRYEAERYFISTILARYMDDVYLSQYYRFDNNYLENQINSFEFEKLSEDLKKIIKKGNRKMMGIDRMVLPISCTKPWQMSPNVSGLTEKDNGELITKIRKSFCHVVTETRFVTPYPYISEKVLRAIYSKRPFILLAPAGSLKLIKDLGFETFSNHWSENYDLIQDPYKRFESIAKIVNEILEKDLDELKDMLKSMETALERNFLVAKNLDRCMKRLSNYKD